jgi:uncharacterized membrane protein
MDIRASGERSSKMEAAMTSVFAIAGSLLALSLGTVPLSITTIDVEAGPHSVNGSAAQGINDRGDVVGFTRDKDVNVYPYLVRKGVVTFLKAPASWVVVGEGWAGAAPRSINASGDIAGGYYLADGTAHGFLRSHHGKWTRLDVPGAEGATDAKGINGPGEIVGAYSANGWNSSSGFLFRPGHHGAPGHYLSIDYPGADATQAWGINDDGDVVGYCDNWSLGTTHGFLLHEGDFTTFDVPGAQGTIAVAINSRGEIAGHFWTADGGYHGYLLSKGTYTTFDVPGATVTAPMSINDHGEMVGFYFDAAGMAHGFKAVKDHH